jgi:subtilase family serine protease
VIRYLGFTGAVSATLFSGFALALAVGAQTHSGSLSAPPLVTQPIDTAQRVTLLGNTRPEANAQNDRGAVLADFPMPHMMLQLKRSPAQEQAIETLIDQMHDRASPNFHSWLTPAQFGAQFGLAAADLQTIAGWLAGRGFQVNQVYPNGMLIDFSGTAGQVQEAFSTEIHNLSVAGVPHFANMSDPQIPAALAPAVAGIVSLHDFRPQPEFARNSDYTFGNTPTYAVTPADLATIYNFNPLFAVGISGQGQTIYLIEPTNLYTNNDWTTFRGAFGLAAFTDGSLTTIHPTASGGAACGDPGTNSHDGEAILDAEYAGSSAPSAAIVMATCADTTTPGVLIAVENLINGDYAPSVISMSYGECETLSGATQNAAFNAAYQQGVAEGVSIFVSGGDQEGSACNRGTTATYGFGVNGHASTPYNVAVGGTDFSDTYSKTNSTYWSSTNASNYGSALSYIPEIPWNSSCASQLRATFEGFSTTYGALGYCNSGLSGKALDDWGGGGGPSGCATGTPSTAGVVSGSCQGYAKPSWQAGVIGIPNDGVRDLPDVSLFASFGPWDHAYIICWSDPKYASSGAKPCTGAPDNWSNDNGGTSFAAPIMAGIQTLVNQYTGAKQGNPNYTYYRIAAAEYGATGSSACNSSNGTGTGSSCVFHDVTLGDNDAPCTGTNNCYLPSGTYGVLSSSDSAFDPTYRTATGWDFATGLGSVNAYNLAIGWNAAAPPPAPLVAAILPESRSAVVGNPVTAFATIINTGASTASACSIAPVGNLPIDFLYQTTNPATNVLTGTANTPVDIAGNNGAQSFLIAVTPSAAFNPTQLPFTFGCGGVAAAPSETGLNTLLVSASTSPVPDIVALVATASNDGILHIPGASGSNAFAVATVNLGSASPITVSINTGGATLPLTLTLCQTDPSSSQCTSAIGATVTTTIAANATPTFAVFGTASGAIPFNPANSRIFVQFSDSTGAVRGETSVAVETQ